MGVFENYFSLGTINAKSPDWAGDSQTVSVGQKFTYPSQILLALLIILLSLILVLKLFDLQVVNSRKSILISDGNRIRVNNLPSARGIILDRKKIPLVQNIAQYQLQIIGANLPDKKQERKAIFDKIKAISGKSIPNEQKLLSTKVLSPQPVIVAPNIPQDEALKMQVELADIPGAQIIYLPTRQYLSGAGLGHILGYVGKISPDELQKFPEYGFNDKVGKQGLEKSYEKYLKGIDGTKQMEVDSRGRLQRIIAKQSPRIGANLVLSLDIGLQKKAVEALSEQMDKTGSKASSAVALNPQTGQVYALVSLPDYDNNIFVDPTKKNLIESLLGDPNNPLVNRAIAGVYPSGSIIKPLVAAGALEERVVSENFRVDTPAEIKIGKFVFPDWKDHGLTDIRRAIAESNNIFFYALGGGWGKIKGLGAFRLANYLKSFGLGEKTGIDLAPESSGLVPDPNWKKKAKNQAWYIGDTYHLAIGQGDISITPLQIIRAISAIANGGNLLKPQLVDKILDQNGKELFTFNRRAQSRLNINEKNLRIVREGMEQAFEYGSARFLQGVTDKDGHKINMAGKTGTAQFGEKDKTHAWFVSYAPQKNPQIAIVVLVEGGGGGHDVALPVAKKMYQYWFSERDE